MKKNLFISAFSLVLLAGLFSAFLPKPAPFTLPPLPYAADALEPHFDKMTMEIHHDRHHKAYVDNLNKAVDGTPLANMKFEEILRDISKHPENIRTAVRNNGGGHYNHSMFWTILDPDNTDKPSGELSAALDKKFGSYDKFKEEFAKAAATRFGSGWAWLIVDNKGELKITSTPNQDNPLMDVVPAEDRGFPVMGLDVWEHAYYLKFQNKRADYITAFWNVINWKEVSNRYAQAKKK
jgi:superoxide dismutase, Fe-Mn family